MVTGVDFLVFSDKDYKRKGPPSQPLFIKGASPNFGRSNFPIVGKSYRKLKCNYSNEVGRLNTDHRNERYRDFRKTSDRQKISVFRLDLNKQPISTMHRILKHERLLKVCVTQDLRPHLGNMKLPSR